MTQPTLRITVEALGHDGKTVSMCAHHATIPPDLVLDPGITAHLRGEPAQLTDRQAGFVNRTARDLATLVVPMLVHCAGGDVPARVWMHGRMEMDSDGVRSIRREYNHQALPDTLGAG